VDRDYRTGRACRHSRSSTARDAGEPIPAPIGTPISGPDGVAGRQRLQSGVLQEMGVWCALMPNANANAAGCGDYLTPHESQASGRQTQAVSRI